MSCFNLCKKCTRNKDDYCKFKSIRINYFRDTSLCEGFNPFEDDKNFEVYIPSKALQNHPRTGGVTEGASVASR